MTRPTWDTEFGDRLRHARLRKCVGQKELAEVLGRDQASVSRYERGEQLMSIRNLVMVVEHLKVDPLWLLLGVDRRRP